ncbi:flippase [Patescibacteria group bacterium]
MNYTKKIVYNTASQALGRIIIVIISLFMTAFLTRYLGATYYGFYTLITTYLAIATSFYDFGVGTIGSREIAKKNQSSQKIMGDVFSLRLIFGLIIFLAVFIVSKFAYSGDSVVALQTGMMIASITIIINNLSSSWISVFIANLKMEYIALSEVINKIVVFSGILLILKFDLGFYPIIGLIVLGNLAQLSIITWFAKILFQLKIVFTRTNWKKILADSWPLGLFLILANLLFRVDSIFISYLRPLKEVGLYGAAFKIFDIILIFAAYYAGSVFPIISKKVNDKDHLGITRVLQGSFDFLWITSVSIAVLIFYLSREIINIIAGPEFFAAIPALQILAVGVIFGFFNAILGYLMIAQNRQKITLVIIFIGLVINVILNLIFIPRFGFVAAATTTTFAEFITLALTAYFMFKFYKIKLKYWNIIQSSAFLILLILFLWISSGFVSGYFKFLVVGLALVICYTLLIYFNKDFRRIVFDLLKLNKNNEK